MEGVRFFLSVNLFLNLYFWNTAQIDWRNTGLPWRHYPDGFAR